jgi:hypothetical protein
MATETKTDPIEVVEPLSAVEASLIKTVGEFRERERQRLEAQWQQVLFEANKRIEPVLRAHGLGEGDEFEIRDDATSATGVAIAIKKGTASASTPPAPLDRLARRRLQKEITKKAGRQGGR